jgi:hypothetical protein
VARLPELDKASIKVIDRDVRRQDLLGSLVHEYYGRAA